jgi:YrbI family 3-deoxy-D-manno-octulosonate 8-phosphate phosphatase
MLKKAGLTIFVLSTESDPVVEMRCRKLGVRCEQGVGDKGHYLNLRFTGLLGTLLYMGDDINDLECLKLASVGVTVADGHPECKAVAHYVTVARGGDHAVREVCDLILEARKET